MKYNTLEKTWNFANSLLFENMTECSGQYNFKTLGRGKTNSIIG